MFTKRFWVEIDDEDVVERDVAEDVVVVAVVVVVVVVRDEAVVKSIEGERTDMMWAAAAVRLSNGDMCSNSALRSLFC